MIWHRGEIMADDALRISVLDRTFEHGLGLFETFRTWNGHPTLLDRHLDRVERSAHALGLPLDRADLPDASAVFDLVEANRARLAAGQDVRLRITMSGGRPEAPASLAVLWMTAGPLPPPTREPGLIIADQRAVTADDPLANYKTLNYWSKQITQSRAARSLADDVLFVTPDGYICETSRTNIFLVEDGRLRTPGVGADGPLLPGIMRGLVLEQAERSGVEFSLDPLPIESIAGAGEAFLTNSLRGMLPVARLLDRALPAPGPVTRRLWDEILPWLESGGKAP
jgi:branched-subunit amino acid aminotransferase/4-amino-4-deoxychorismate lyase